MTRKIQTHKLFKLSSVGAKKFLFIDIWEEEKNLEGNFYF